MSRFKTHHEGQGLVEYVLVLVLVVIVVVVVLYLVGEKMPATAGLLVPIALPSPVQVCIIPMCGPVAQW